MSYLARKIRRSKPSTMGALGDVASSITNALSSAASTIATAGRIAADPYLPEVVCHVEQLAQIRGGEPVRTCVAIPQGRPGGIGMSRAVIPMRAYVYAEQHKWVYPIAIGAAIGIPMLIGYYMGKD